MNKARRELIDRAIDNMSSLKDDFASDYDALKEKVDQFIGRWQDKIQEVLSDVEQARDDEQEYYDNMPDSFRDGEKGDNAAQAVSYLEDAANNIQSVIDSLSEIELSDSTVDIDEIDNAIENLDNAKVQ